MEKLYPKSIELTKNLIKQMKNVDGASVSLEVGEQLIDTIEAQQQEIERLKNALDDWKYQAKCDADHIWGLISDKDEQAGKIMRLMEALEEATEEIENIYGHDTPQTEKYRELLGGAEDETNPV